VTSGLTLLVVGGTGTFGSRVAALLEVEPGIDLVLASRSLDRARAACAGRRARPAAFDRDGDVDAALAAIAPRLVVDASGPFQAYGPRPYRLAAACIAAGIDYADLADGTGFVRGIAALDAAARARGVFALAGASTCPALSGAVVRQLAAGLAPETVTVGIAPSPRAQVGEGVVRAIASYAGAPIRRPSPGGPAAHGFADHRRLAVAPPGGVPLRPRLFSLVDVPDLALLPEEWPSLADVWVGAAPGQAGLHRLLIALAHLRRRGLAPALGRFAPLMHRALRLFRGGEDRGGMVVAVTGRDAQGARRARSWHLAAEGDAGPFIPAMAISALARRLVAGRRPAPGARPAGREFALAEFQPHFALRGIVAGERDDAPPPGTPLYARVLGEAWARLAPEIRSLHDLGAGEATWAGRAAVERGRSTLSRLAGAVIGFPPAAADVPIRVTFAVRQGRERWTRRFGDRHFFSDQEEGQGRAQGLVIERFGPLAFAMAVAVRDGRLDLIQRGWRAFGVPMPRRLGPAAAAGERVEDGRFRFAVSIRHWLTGPIVRYRGWLAPEQVGAPVRTTPAPPASRGAPSPPPGSSPP
jgi:hypothetical protein